MVHAKSLVRKIFQCKDLLHEIMVLLEAEDLCHIAQTSHKCRAAANDDRLWRRLFIAVRCWANWRGAVDMTATAWRLTLAKALHAGAWCVKPVQSLAQCNMLSSSAWRFRYASRHLDRRRCDYFAFAPSQLDPAAKPVGAGSLKARQREHFVRGRGTVLRDALASVLSRAMDGDIIRVLPNATSHANDHGNDRAPTDLPSQCLQDLVVRQRVHIARAYADERGNVCEGRAELSFGLVLHSPARVTGLSIDLRHVNVEEWRETNGGVAEPREPACVRIGGPLAEHAAVGGQGSGQQEHQQSIVEVEGCVLHSATGGCALAVHTGSRACVAGNLLVGGTGGAIIHSGAKAALCENEVRDVRGYAVHLVTDEPVFVRGNTLRGSFVGVGAHGHSPPATYVTSNLIESNVVGLECEGESAPTVDSNTVRHNRDGIIVRDTAQPLLIGNNISGNRRDGFSAHGSASATLKRNTLRGNGGAGVLMSADTMTVIRGNTICDNRGLGGLVALGTSFAAVEDNDLDGNRGAGAVVGDDAMPRLVGNRLRRNGLAGVTVMNDAAPHLERNVVHANFRAGVYISGSATPMLRSNDIAENEGTGVLCSGAARAHLEGNVIHDNCLAGVEAETTKSTPASCDETNVFRNNGGGSVVIRDRDGEQGQQQCASGSGSKRARCTLGTPSTGSAEKRLRVQNQ